MAGWREPRRGAPAGEELFSPEALLGSLQLADSFFPSGGYTLSHGLEAYAEAGLLDAVSLPPIVSELLRWSVGPSDGAALAMVCRAAQANDLDRIAAVDRRLTAVKLGREPRQASSRLGRQLLALARDALDNDLAAAYLARARREDLPGNQAVAMGLLKTGFGIPVREAVLGELYAFAASCVASAVRMSLVDHRQAQRALRSVAPAAIAAADDALDRELWEIGGSAPFAEIMTMRHETAAIRVFAT